MAPTGQKPIDPGLIGAANESKAAAWYLARGHQVYVPLCKNGPVDFIIDNKHGRLLRVQVKTAAWVKNNHNYRYLQVPTRSINNSKKVPLAVLYDLLFVVFEECFWEIPAAIITSGNIVLDGEYKRKTKAPWRAYRVQ